MLRFGHIFGKGHLFFLIAEYFARWGPDLRENYKIFCSIVVYPVIPKGHIIYRLIPTAEHTQEEIDLTLKAFSETKAKLDAGDYKSEVIPDMANK